MTKVIGARRREETLLRLGGNGDNWNMTWAADDRQYVAMDDGYGFGQEEVFYNSRLLALSGGPEEATFGDVPGYPELAFDLGRPSTWWRYYGFGTLAVDGRIYQFLSTPNNGFDEPGPRFVGAKLIFSPDGGRSWHNQDGSTPVVWEDWGARSAANMAFFEEPGESFSLLTILQMGKDYSQNEDGYVYVYAPNGNDEGTMNQLVMFRVPKEKLLDRGAYEFFAGFDSGGEPTWSGDVARRGVVCSFPEGWVNTWLHPYSWHPSVVYNAPLDVYMMANWGMGSGADGEWFARPSYLGLWTAPAPWGPWTQIHEETAWTPGADPRARAYEPQIAPKWIAADGRSFWLVWTDYQLPPGMEEVDLTEWYEVRTKGGRLPDDTLKGLDQLQPYYSFNAQRVDLVVE